MLMTIARVVARVALPLAFGGVALSSCGLTGGVDGPSTGVLVRGAISPCSGSPFYNGPRFAAGTVAVLEGRTSMAPVQPGLWRTVFPPVVVARQTVGVNQIFAFRLKPGPYVLMAHYLSGNVAPWISVTVRHKPLRAIIPDECK